MGEWITKRLSQIQYSHFNLLFLLLLINLPFLLAFRIAPNVIHPPLTTNSKRHLKTYFYCINDYRLLLGCEQKLWQHMHTNKWNDGRKLSTNVNTTNPPEYWWNVLCRKSSVAHTFVQSIKIRVFCFGFSVVDITRWNERS